MFFLDKPEIDERPGTTVNESQRVILTRKISSNPVSNVYWYDRSELLDAQLSTNNATLIIEKALCTDTTNFTLIANNTVGESLTAIVELRVNCEYFSLFKVTSLHHVFIKVFCV